MTRYERQFPTDWDRISPNDAADHAYAIGVGEQLGEENRDHLARLLEEMGTGYARSLVELAYREGRSEAKKRLADGEEDLWADLIEDEESGGFVMDGRDGLPRALELMATLERTDIDSRDSTKLPDFLRR